MKETVYETTHDFGKVLSVVAVVTIVACILLVHVWNRYRITELGYEIANVTHQHRRLIEENKKLSIEVAVQGRTERMTVVARESFGLEPLQALQVKSLPLTGAAPTENQNGGAEVALGF